ncbi:hypothetical protein [Streptomyces sp. NPDC059874]|uniref:hypothetical protein n=1 Tax=Streptomyces sp. NPDC059874 TaxID=3346983 RepID=UPI003656701C
MAAAEPHPRPHLTDWLASIAAVIALVVAFLGYLQASAANKEARRANNEARRANDETERLVKREQAAQISFYWQRKDGKESLQLVNHSLSWIADVIVSFKDGTYIDVGSLGGCTEWSIEPFARRDPDGTEQPLATPARLDFTDSLAPSGTWTVTDRLRPQQEVPTKNEEISASVSTHLADTEHCG